MGVFAMTSLSGGKREGGGVVVGEEEWLGWGGGWEGFDTHLECKLLMGSTPCTKSDIGHAGTYPWT